MATLQEKSGGKPPQSKALGEKFREDEVGDGEARGSEAGARAIEEEEAVGAEELEARAEGDVVAMLEALPVDAIEEAEAEEEFFVECLLRGELFALLDGESAGGDRGDVGGGVVGVGPARVAVEGMSAGADAEVGETLPVFEVVEGAEGGGAG